MEESHKLALYIAYYLSKFDKTALTNLGYSTWNNSFDDISKKLKVEKHSVRNWRDEFDPIHGHRAGWYQRPMSPSRVRVVNALGDMEEEEIRSLVVDILNGRIKEDSENIQELLRIVSQEESNRNPFILRGPTGRKAEEFFIEYHQKYSKPIGGKIKDTREYGCGYDFEIENFETYYIEVKGMINENGGILFTNKEWETALKYKHRYILAIVRSVNSNPKIDFLPNPTSKLKAKKNIVTTIHLNWSVTPKELKNVINE